MSALEPQCGGDTETTNHELLFSYIAHNDVACPVCGYNLRALTTDICPECGQQFRLQIGGPSVRFGLFLAFLAPMIMVVGLAMLFIVLVAIIPPRPRWPQDWGIYAICLGGVINGLLIPLFYRGRQRFPRRVRPRQIGLISFSWVMQTLIVFMSFKFGMR